MHVYTNLTTSAIASINPSVPTIAARPESLRLRTFRLFADVRTFRDSVPSVDKDVSGVSNAAPVCISIQLKCIQGVFMRCVMYFSVSYCAMHIRVN